MIKEKLMSALKTAAAEYNGGMGASAAVAKAAEAADFNAEQTDRLVEMFNTTAAINQFKTASDRSASCELADKAAVARMLLGDGAQKKASAPLAVDYSFYSEAPHRTTPSIEARSAGRGSLMKAASAAEDVVPADLDISQGSLYKVIMGKIDLLKSAADAADEAARSLRTEADSAARRIAQSIERYDAHPELADMFKQACQSKTAVECVAEFSTKVAESDGGRFARMHVFDSSPVDHLLKEAERMETMLSDAAECEAKRDRFMAKAAEAKTEMQRAVGLAVDQKDCDKGLSGMLSGGIKSASAAYGADRAATCAEPAVEKDVNLFTKIAQMIRDSGATADSVVRLAEDLEKEAAGLNFSLPAPGVEESHRALAKSYGIDAEEQRLLNARRAILLARLMSDDPIIRDADPQTIVDAYKTMVMTSPRVSLDPSQVRSFLRTAAGVEAISPSDAKVLADVDRGTMISNSDVMSKVNQLTSMDSSIKDSNRA